MAEADAEALFRPQAYTNAPSDSLKVIGLISGGKDSFYSLLHCMRNGHQIVALGNLYPPAPKQQVGCDDVEEDLNSFMYQTVGHTVIPYYETLTGIPLYRQEILGRALQTAVSYAGPSQDDGHMLQEDETESLTVLLKRIMQEHPEANAVCSGAILSTYQRTRIESVALRLGLVPLAYLWQYTLTRPESQSALLMDMYHAGLDARIVKVASGGLDERHLWTRVSDPRGVAALTSRMRKFGSDGDGSVIGEGGEYETITVGGPSSLFRGRIEVDLKDLTTVSEGGGTKWLKIGKIQIVRHATDSQTAECKLPDILDSTFANVAACLNGWNHERPMVERTLFTNESLRGGKPNSYILNHTFTAESSQNITIDEQARNVITSIQHFLESHKLSPTSIISSHIILPFMDNFQLVNKVGQTMFYAATID